MPRTIAAVLTLLAAAAGSAPATAGDLSDPEFRKQVAERFPGVEAQHIQPAEAEGLYRISQHGVVGYITSDGRYLLDGDLIDLKKNINYAERERRRWRLQQIQAVDESKMVIFSPEKPRHSLTVFTDVECAYCRMLHAGIDRLIEAGIRVRYLAFPLAGPGSRSFRKAQAVWCADNRKQALTRAKRDKSVSGEPDCGNGVVMQTFELAFNTLGLRGTPTLITESGEILPPGLSVGEVIQRTTAAETPRAE